MGKSLIDLGPGGELKPVLTLIHEGELFEDPITVGTSRYLVVLPAEQRCFGLTLRITAFPDRLTTYVARATDVYRTGNEAFREMGVSEVHRMLASNLADALEPWIAVVKEGAESDGARASRYVVMFPVIKRSVGIVVRYRSSWWGRRQYEPVRVTSVTSDADRILREMA